MCHYISSDVLLANLLFYSKSAQVTGVSYSELKKYCEKIKQELINVGCNKNDYILFNLNRDELNEDILLHPDSFYKFQHKYYGLDIKIDNFENRVSNIIYDVMKKVAKEFKTL